VSQERTRRAFLRRRWARRWLSWRRALLVLLVVGVLGLGAYAVWFSAWLRAEQVSVTGADQLSVAEVERVAAVPLDEPLARVDLDAVPTSVHSLAIVNEVDVVRRHVGSRTSESVERQAVAAVTNLIHAMRGEKPLAQVNPEVPFTKHV
jgi:cell division protein FtsQ